MSHQLKTIYQSSLQFLQHLSLQETYEAIAQEVKSLIGAEHVSLFIEQNGTLERVYATDPRLYTIHIREDGNTYKVFHSLKPYIHTRETMTTIHPELTALSVGSDLCIPLTFDNQKVGVLSALSPSGIRFSKKELKALELFRPVATLAIKNAQFHEEMQQALEKRDLFISLASHEMKNPLTSLLVYLEMLQKHIPKDQRSSSTLVYSSMQQAQKLKQLLDELTNIDNIKQGILHINYEECSLGNIVSQVIESFHVSHPEYKVSFRNELSTYDDYVMGDAIKLSQVLTNILTNAAKFSPPHSEIVIVLMADQNQVKVQIVDKGRGISKQDLPKIFEKYYKGNKGVGGMGLGLYLVKQIVEGHRGTISVDSQLNKGTAVTFTLPKNDRS